MDENRGFRIWRCLHNLQRTLRMLCKGCYRISPHNRFLVDGQKRFKNATCECVRIWKRIKIISVSKNMCWQVSILFLTTEKNLILQNLAFKIAYFHFFNACACSTSLIPDVTLFFFLLRSTRIVGIQTKFQALYSNSEGFLNLVQFLELSHAFTKLFQRVSRFLFPQNERGTDRRRTKILE